MTQASSQPSTYKEIAMSTQISDSEMAAFAAEMAELDAKMNAQVVSEYGFTRGQLLEVYNRCTDPNDVRGPIAVSCTGEGVLAIVEAIKFFTATNPTVRLNTNTMRYLIESEGYRMGPAGDH
jgi:hypothetical protein